MRELLGNPTSIYRSTNHISGQISQSQPLIETFERPPTDLISEAIRDVEQTRRCHDYITARRVTATRATMVKSLEKTIDTRPVIQTLVFSLRLNNQLTIQWIGLWNIMCIAVTSDHVVSNQWQLNHLFNNLFRLTVKKIQRTTLLALCVRPPQRASDAEGVSKSWYFHEWPPGMTMIATVLLTGVRVLSAGWDDSVVIRVFQESFVACLVKSFVLSSVPAGSEEVLLPVDSTAQGVRHNFRIDPWNKAGRVLIVLRLRIGALVF